MKCHHGLFCPVSNSRHGAYASDTITAMSVRDNGMLQHFNLLLDCDTADLKPCGGLPHFLRDPDEDEGMYATIAFMP